MALPGSLAHVPRQRPSSARPTTLIRARDASHAWELSQTVAPRRGRSSPERPTNQYRPQTAGAARALGRFARRPVGQPTRARATVPPSPVSTGRRPSRAQSVLGSARAPKSPTAASPARAGAIPPGSLSPRRQATQARIADARRRIAAQQALLASVTRCGSVRKWFLRHSDADGAISRDGWHRAALEAGVSDPKVREALFDGAVMGAAGPGAWSGLLDAGASWTGALLKSAAATGAQALRAAGVARRQEKSGCNAAGATAWAPGAAVVQQRTSPPAAARRLSYTLLHEFIQQADALDSEARALAAAEQGGKLPARKPPPSESRLMTDGKEAVRSLLEYFQTRGIAVTGDNDGVEVPTKIRHSNVLRRLFKTFDDNGHGDLSYETFAKVLGPEHLNLSLKRDQVLAACYELDQAQRGSIRWQDITRAMQQTFVPPVHVDPRRGRQRLRESLQDLATEQPAKLEQTLFGEQRVHRRNRPSLPRQASPVSSARLPPTDRRRSCAAVGASRGREERTDPWRTLLGSGGYGPAAWAAASDSFPQHEDERRRKAHLADVARRREHWEARHAASMNAIEARRRRIAVGRLQSKARQQLRYMATMQIDSATPQVVCPPGAGALGVILAAEDATPRASAFPCADTLPHVVVARRLRSGATR